MISINYFKFSARQLVVIAFFLSFVVCNQASFSTPLPSTSPKTKITRKPFEVEDLNHGKYTGGADVDELYKTTTSSSSHSHSHIPSKVDRSSDHTAADSMLRDSDPDNVIEEVTEFAKHDASRRITTNVAAAIVAAICLFVALTSYGALMTWRRMTNARYANRAMLLTDDDMGDIQDEDLRHFEAACIQIEG